MPSVMTTHNGIAASTASMTASFAKAGGTKTTDTSASVSFIASDTVAKTGTEVPSTSTVVPALRGFTPPTTCAPEATIRRVCLVPSEPVMPWTMILEFSVSQIAMSCVPRPLLAGQLGRASRGAVHGVALLEQRQLRLREDPAAVLGVVAVQADDERVRDLVAALLQEPERLHDAVRDRVARGDAAEHVDEHRLHVGVAEDDLETVDHHLGRGAAADVEEVGRLHPAVRLTGVRHDVERRHHEAGTVADDADRAVELHVVEVLRLGLRLERVGGELVLEARVVGLPEVGVAVEGHLAVEGDDAPVGRLHERVDLDQRGVLGHEDTPELHDGRRDLVAHVLREAALLGDLGTLGVVDALERVDRDPGQRLGLLDGELLDLHAALAGGHREVGA